MKHFKESFTILCLLSLLFTACEEEDLSVPDASTNQDEPYRNLGITHHDRQTLRGSTTMMGSEIAYGIEGTDEGLYQVALNIDGHALGATLEPASASLTVTGDGFALTRSQGQALRDLSVALDLYTNAKGDVSENVTEAEYLLIRLMSYWSSAPEGYQYAGFSVGSFNKSKNARNEGITCVRRNTQVQAQFGPGDNSTGWLWTVFVGGTLRGRECVGRCGAECSTAVTIASSWTKDCLDHDVCSAYYMASGGTGDFNCGDEFDQAADDFIFGVIRGCNGA